ncbi:MAG: DUF7000 family protein [Candidatus Thorarchaeota archaeon]|jgi:hypothetical protein
MAFQENMNEYRRQIEEGAIVEAYRGLMDYFNTLRLYFEKKYPNYSVSGSVYYGFMDMTYFAIFPKSLKRRKLKIAIVFLHEAFQFEVWLSGNNRKVQSEYCKLIGESDWKKYNLSSTAKGVDSILDHILVENPDFSDLDALTNQIEKGTLIFTADVENFLSHHS